MIGKELRETFQKGITLIVEFTEEVEDFELRFEEGMRAYITNITSPDKSGCIDITFEEKDFVNYNKSIEKPEGDDWILNLSNLKFSETEGAKKWNGKLTFCEGEDDEIFNFKIIENNSLKLFNEYKNSNTNISYIKWLEQKLIELRGK